MTELGKSGLSFRVEGLRVETRGLAGHDHPELAVEVSHPGELGAARALLISLAADVIVRGNRFSAGMEIPYGGEVLRPEVATLELWERDAESGELHRGAPRLIAALQEGS